MGLEPDDAFADQVHDALRLVIDPELGCNIVELGLVYSVAVDGGGSAHIVMTTTTPGCPAAAYLTEAAKRSASKVSGIRSVRVELTYDPQWTPAMIEPDARTRLGIGNAW